MNHDAARQKEGDKLWHYTRANKRTGVYPIGYCAEDCAGHTTAAEAQGHYKQYVLDNAQLKDDSAEPTQLNRCEADGCKAMTDGAAGYMGYHRFTLCKEHRTRETLDKLVSIGEAWHS